MKIGTDTGSIINYVKGNTSPVEPQPDMGATLLHWTDRSAYTIHKVEGKKLWASLDQAELIEGSILSESQTYRYYNTNKDNPTGWILFTLRKDGRWHMGTTLKGAVLSIETRDEYRDPSF